MDLISWVNFNCIRLRTTRLEFTLLTAATRQIFLVILHVYPVLQLIHLENTSSFNDLAS